MSKFFIGSIDLNKIKKELIVTKDKNGNEFKNGAKYVNVAIWLNDEADQYGNIGSIQMGGKEEKIYIGNFKEYQKQNQVEAVEDSSDLPF